MTSAMINQRSSRVELAGGASQKQVACMINALPESLSVLADDCIFNQSSMVHLIAAMYTHAVMHHAVCDISRIPGTLRISDISGYTGIQSSASGYLHRVHLDIRILEHPSIRLSKLS
jgi:hypothetical protein